MLVRCAFRGWLAKHWFSSSLCGGRDDMTPITGYYKTRCPLATEEHLP